MVRAHPIIDESEMRYIFRQCAGLDIHKRTVVACRVQVDQEGELFMETKTFGTMTADLLQLSHWLSQREDSHVAMESTGDYWKPVSNLLEDDYMVKEACGGADAHSQLSGINSPLTICVGNTDSQIAIQHSARARYLTDYSAAYASSQFAGISLATARGRRPQGSPLPRNIEKVPK